MSGSGRRAITAGIVVVLVAAAFLAGRWTAPRETVVVREPATITASATPAAPRAERPVESAPENADAGPKAPERPAPTAVKEPTAPPAPSSSLRDVLAAFVPPTPGKSASGDPWRPIFQAASETQKSEERRAEMWALLESETDPAVLRGLVVFVRRRPLSPATPADRDRAWELLLRDGPTERRRAAGTLWILGESWSRSPDGRDRIVQALDGAVPYELLGTVAWLLEEDALGRDPEVHDALVRAVERAPPSADLSHVTPSLSNPWVRHDTHRDLMDAWRAARDPEKRAKLSEAYAAVLVGTTGGFADGPPVRGHPLESPIVRGTVEVYAGTTDKGVRARIAAGIWKGLRLEKDARQSLTREFAENEPDPEFRARLLRVAEEHAVCVYESRGELAKWLAGGPAAVAK